MFIPSVGAAPFNDTVHASVAGPVIELFAQATDLTPGRIRIVPSPLRLTVTVSLFVALLAMASCPVAFPETAGSNCTVSVML
jgi:hypothetical protein